MQRRDVILSFGPPWSIPSGCQSCRNSRMHVALECVLRRISSNGDEVDVDHIAGLGFDPVFHDDLGDAPFRIFGNVGHDDSTSQGLGVERICSTVLRRASWTSVMWASSLYGLRGQKNPFSPSFFRLGTIWMCRWGTLWLIRLLTATKEPSAESPASTALAISLALENSGPMISSGRSSMVE